MSTDRATRRFMNAASDLLGAVSTQARDQDRAAYDGLTAILNAGGMVEIRGTFAPRTGMAWMNVEVTTTAGDRHTLASAELHKAALS